MSSLMDQLYDTAPETLMISQSLIFILFWLSLHLYVSRNGPIRGASTITKCNSCVYSAASLVLLVLILLPSDDMLARRLYHASKFYEYVDILNVRATGASIDLHFGFHHLTTPYLTFIRVVQNSRGWKPFAALNAFHHTLMYAFFGGVGWLQPLLPWTGYLQLVVGIGVESWLVGEKMRREGRDAGPNVIAGFILTAYLVLFTRGLVIRNREGVRQKSD
jgi:hypothetical protein